MRSTAARLVVIVALLIGLWPSSALAQPSCRFVLGFAALRDLVGPQKVGNCLEDEHFNLENGNAEQRTAGGLLVWRKGDNFTAFTDGGTTWINGPNGLQSRPNGERFSWERDPVSNQRPEAAQPSSQLSGPQPPVVPTAPPSPTPTPVPLPPSSQQPRSQPAIEPARNVGPRCAAFAQQYVEVVLRGYSRDTTPMMVYCRGMSEAAGELGLKCLEAVVPRVRSLQELNALVVQCIQAGS